MIVYLAGPIDSVVPEGRMTLREEACQALAHHDVAAFDPSRAYHHPSADANGTFTVNEAAIAACDGMLALLPDGYSTVGTPMEIKSARDLGRPVAVVGGHHSMQLKAMRVPTFPSADGGIQWLKSKCALRSFVRKYANLLPAQDESDWVLITGDPGCIPKKGYEGDAGFDLHCSADMIIQPGGFVDVPCGINVQLPPGVWAMITGRSSTLRKRQLLVSQGVIDNGYRGPLFAGVYNLSDEVKRVLPGERIAQLIPFPLTSATMKFVMVDQLEPSDRGEAGFGSTGV